MIGTQTQRPCWVVQSGGTAFLRKLTEPMRIIPQSSHPCEAVQLGAAAQLKNPVKPAYQTLQANNKPTFVGFFVPAKKSMDGLEAETLRGEGFFL